jgi:hypothetical protein
MALTSVSPQGIHIGGERGKDVRLSFRIQEKKCQMSVESEEEDGGSRTSSYKADLCRNGESVVIINGTTSPKNQSMSSLPYFVAKGKVGCGGVGIEGCDGKNDEDSLHLIEYESDDAKKEKTKEKEKDSENEKEDRTPLLSHRKCNRSQSRVRSVSQKQPHTSSSLAHSESPTLTHSPSHTLTRTLSSTPSTPQSRATPLKPTPHPSTPKSAPSSVASSVPLQTSLHDFELQDLVGCGTFGRLWKAYHTLTSQHFALKILNKKQLLSQDMTKHTTLEREIMATISYPFICHLFAAFQTSRHVFFVMEYLMGGTLFHHLRLRPRPFTELETLFYASEILLALRALHTNRYVYRDLKLENVLLDDRGHIRLTDFGLSAKLTSRRPRVKSFSGFLIYFILKNHSFFFLILYLKLFYILILSLIF